MGDEFPHRMADAITRSGTITDGFIELYRCFFGHAECPLREDSIHILGGLAGEGKFVIVNDGRAICGDTRKQSVCQSLSDEAAETDLDRVSAHAQEYTFTLLAGAMDSLCGQLQIPGCEDVRKRFQPPAEANA